MTLTWLGTAALLLREDDVRLAFDPFPGIPIGGLDRDAQELPDRALFRTATQVLATHGHLDHILYIPALYGDLDIPVYATGTPCGTLAKHGFPARRLHRIAPGDALDLGPFHVSVYQSRHCKFDGGIIRRTALSPQALSHPVHLLRLLALNRRYPEGGETLFYEIVCRGIRVQIMGSLGLEPETDYPTGADYLVLPFQGRSDLETCALPLVERLAPRRLLLDHYDDSFPPMSSQVPTDGFCGIVGRTLGIPCEPLRKYEAITLEKVESV